MPRTMAFMDTRKLKRQSSDSDMPAQASNIATKRVYKQETLDILAEAKRMAGINKNAGKTREESFQSLFNALEIK